MTARKMKLWDSHRPVNWLALSVLVIIVDQFTKYLVVQRMSLFDSQPIIPHHNLPLLHTTGAAKSLLADAGGVLFSDDFYEAIEEHGIDVVTDRIAKVTGEAIVTESADGEVTEHPVDVIVVGTDDMEERLARLRTLFPNLKLEHTITPSLYDQLLHRLNPRVHKDEHVQLYQVLP